MKEAKLSRGVAKKRAYSNISNTFSDSADGQPSATEMKKPGKVLITINTDKKRTVNGNELVVEQYKPIISFENVSSAEEGEIEDEFEGSDFSNSIDDHLEAILSQDELLSVQDEEEDIHTKMNEVYHSELPRTYWERDDIDVPMVHSKCSMFHRAVLESLESAQKSLTFYYDTDDRNIDSIEDDLLSLHPRTDLETENTPEIRKPRKLSFKNSVKFVPSPLFPQNCAVRSVNNTLPKFTEISEPLEKPKTSPKLIRSFSNTSLPQESPRKLDKTAVNGVSSAEVLPNRLMPQSVLQPSTSHCPYSESNFTIPPGIQQGGPPPSREKLEEINERINGSATQMQCYSPSGKNNCIKKICFNLESCTRRTCKYIHKITSDMFENMSDIDQIGAWRTIKELRRHTVLLRVMDCMPPVCAAIGNKTLLYQMIVDALVFDTNNPFKLVKKIFDSLRSIRINNEELSCDRIVEDVLTVHGCFGTSRMPPNFRIKLITMMLDVLVEEKEFLTYWATFLRIFDIEDYPVSNSIVEKIAKECKKQYVSVELCKVILNRLLEISSLSVDMRDELNTLSDFLAKVERSASGGQTASTHSDVSPACSLPRPLTFGENLRRLFRACTDAEGLSHLFYEYRMSTYWKHAVNEIIGIIKDVNVEHAIGLIKFLRETITHCLMMIEMDEELQLFLSTLIVNILAVTRNFPQDINHRQFWAELICIFEDRLEFYSHAQLYVSLPEYQNSVDMFIFIRLMHGKMFMTAFKWLCHGSFKLPTEGTELYTTHLCNNIRILFVDLHRHYCFTECKDLFVWVIRDVKIDINELQTEKWNLFDYYNMWIKSLLNFWSKRERDILIDAKESIFEFYQYVSIQLLRNVLILLYERVDEVGIEKIAEIAVFCNKFYNQRHDSLYFHKFLTIAEIQMLTHVYFYHMVVNEAIVGDVFVEYDDEPVLEEPPSTVSIGLLSWESTMSTKQRTVYVMRHLKLHRMPTFTEHISNEDAVRLAAVVRQRRRR